MSSRSLEALVDAAAQDKRRGSHRSVVGQMAAIDESQLDSLSELKRKFKDVLRAYWRQHKSSHEGEDTDQYDVAHRIATSIFNLYWDKPNYAGLRPEKKEILNYFVKHIQLSKSREGQSSNPLLRAGLHGPTTKLTDSRASFSEPVSSKASREDEIFLAAQQQRKRSLDGPVSLSRMDVDISGRRRSISETVAPVIPRPPEVLRAIREIVPESQVACSLLIDGSLLQVPEQLVRNEIAHYLLTTYGVGCLVCVLNIGGPIYHILLSSPEECDQLAGQAIRFTFSLAPHVLFRMPSNAALGAHMSVASHMVGQQHMGAMNTPSVSVSPSVIVPPASPNGANSLLNAVAAAAANTRKRRSGDMMDLVEADAAAAAIKKAKDANGAASPTTTANHNNNSSGVPPVSAAAAAAAVAAAAAGEFDAFTAAAAASIFHQTSAFSRPSSFSTVPGAGPLANPLQAALAAAAAVNNSAASGASLATGLLPQLGDDHFVVEKVVHQRMVNGKVQYLLQLKGAELSQPLKIWMFDEDVFAEMDEHRKRTNLTNALTTGVFPTDHTQLPDVEQILGAKLLGSQVMFYVKWANCPVYALVPSSLINAAAPAKVIQFYEARLSFEKHQPISGSASPVAASPPTSPGSLSTTVPLAEKKTAEV